MIQPSELRGGRFVVLRHDHPQLHWDFLLESDSAAATWRLLKYPEPELAIPALQIEDHRLMYLDYEGPVSENRGTVIREHAGLYSGLAMQRSGFSIRLLESSFASLATLSTFLTEHGAAAEWKFSSAAPTFG